MKTKLKKRISLYLIGGIFLSYFFINGLRIYNYSSVYSERKSDVAIVLGAGTNHGKLSPVFRERINHGIYLYKNKMVEKLIFTGGLGKGQKISDSYVAKIYALKKGVAEKDILIEEKSIYTYQNLHESKKIMDSLSLKTALLVSDPLHMKRAMKLAKCENIKCESSPTKSTMYKKAKTKTKFLFYETTFFTLRELQELIN